MKLAYILNTYPEGSHTFIRREIAALERRGFVVLRFAMRRPTSTPADPLDKAEQAKTHYVLEQGSGAITRSSAALAVRSPSAIWQGIRMVVRSASLSDRSGLRHAAYLAEACYLAAQLRAEGVQHIHAHFGTNAATIAMLTGALARIPYSFTVHGPEEFDRPEALDLSGKMQRAAFTVAVSQFGRSQLCRWVEPETRDGIKVVHCGIEPGDFDDPPPLPENRRLICVGRFAEQKGHITLIDAMAKIRDSNPETRLVLVGDGPMRSRIETAIGKYGLEDRIELTGWLDGANVREQLARSQALVMPSFAEGLPVAIMEAMAMGRPVIATYIAGIPELVRPNETGWLVPSGDTQALADAINDLAASPLDRLQAMGQVARDRVLERHNIHTEARRLAGYFEAVAPGFLPR